MGGIGGRVEGEEAGVAFFPRFGDVGDAGGSFDGVEAATAFLGDLLFERDDVGAAEVRDTRGEDVFLECELVADAARLADGARVLGFLV